MSSWRCRRGTFIRFDLNEQNIKQTDGDHVEGTQGSRRAYATIDPAFQRLDGFVFGTIAFGLCVHSGSDGNRPPLNGSRLACGQSFYQCPPHSVLACGAVCKTTNGSYSLSGSHPAAVRHESLSPLARTSKTSCVLLPFSRAKRTPLSKPSLLISAICFICSAVKPSRLS